MTETQIIMVAIEKWSQKNLASSLVRIHLKSNDALYIYAVSKSTVFLVIHCKDGRVNIEHPYSRSKYDSFDLADPKCFRRLYKEIRQLVALYFKFD